MNKTYNRILDLVVEDQGMRAHGGRVRATNLRRQHGATPDEISGKVTTHRSGEKLRWGSTGTQGQSGFKQHGVTPDATNLQRQHGVTPDEISGRVTKHRSGAKLKWGSTGTQGQSGFNRSK